VQPSAAQRIGQAEDAPLPAGIRQRPLDDRSSVQIDPHYPDRPTVITPSLIVSSTFVPIASDGTE
jgi:hypothetical protein